MITPRNGSRFDLPAERCGARLIVDEFIAFDAGYGVGSKSLPSSL
jgi:hypothetical protein